MPSDRTTPAAGPASEPRVFVVVTVTHIYAASSAEAEKRVRGAVERVTPGPVESRVTPIEHVPLDGSCRWCEWVKRAEVAVDA